MFIAGRVGNPEVTVLLDDQLCQAGYLKISNVGLCEIMIIIGLIASLIFKYIFAFISFGLSGCKRGLQQFSQAGLY